MATLQNQRVSNATKSKEVWWRETMDYWIERAIEEGTERVNEATTNIEFSNGNINMATLQYALKPLVPDEDVDKLLKELPGKLREVDFITSVREKYQGEYIELPYKFHVKSNNPEAVLAWNADLKPIVRQRLQQSLINYMNESPNGANPVTPSKEQESIEMFIKSETERFFNERAIEAQKKLNLINDIIGFETKRQQQFFYWFATEQFYDYRTIIDGEFVHEIIAPYEAFPILNGEQFVDDMDGCLIRREITWNDFERKYRDRLSKKEFDYVEETVLSNKNKSGGGDVSDLIKSRLITNYGSDYYKNNVTAVNRTKIPDSTSKLTEHIIQFKSQKRVKILKYKDETGEAHEIEVADDYELDTANGDISTEDLWVEELRTGVRIGDKYLGIYIEPEVDIIQRRDPNNPRHVKLNICGKVGILNDIDINPIPKRLSVYQALDRLILLRQEQFIARYKDSILTIPQSTLHSKKKSKQQQYYYMLADGVWIYDDSQITADDMSKAFRIVGNPSGERYLSTLIEIRRENYEEAMRVANMTQERMGNTNPRSGKSVMEQNIFRARISSTLMIDMFNKALEKSHLADLEASKYAWVNGKYGTFYDRSTNRMVDVNIDGPEHFFTEYGMTIVNSKAEERKSQAYQNLGFSASQHGDYDIASQAIDMDNVAEGKEIMRKLVKAKREFEKSQSESQLAAIEKQGENEKARDERDHLQEMEILEYKEDRAYERELLKSNTAIAVAGAIDEGDNKAELEYAKNYVKERELEFKERQEANKIRAHDKDLAFKEKQLKVQKQTSNANKN